MSTARLLLDLLDNDLQLWEEAGSIGFRGPKGALTPELRQRLLADKAALVDLLRNGHKHVRPSYSQQRLWFLDQLDPGAATYNMPDAVTLRGPLNRAALAAALTEITHRHDVLRCVFSSLKGQPIVLIAPPGPESLPYVDLAGLNGNQKQAEAQRLVDCELLRPFDLAAGPLLRATLLRHAHHEHVLLLNLHHAVSDGWSQAVLFRELSALYRAVIRDQPSPLPPLAKQYVDFATWQRQRLAGERLQHQLDSWRRQLDSVQALELPTDRPRQPRPRYRGAVAPFKLDVESTTNLRQLSMTADASLFMALSAGLAILLQRLSGQDEILFGTPVANRPRQEFESLIGFFVNSLILRHEVSATAHFAQLLEHARKTTLHALSHQDLPFEKLVEELQPQRDLSRNPIFQVSLAFLNAPREKVRLPGLALTPWGFQHHVVRLDLEIFLWEVGQPTGRTTLEGEIYYDLDLWDAATIHRWIRHFARLLQGAVRNPLLELRQLSILEPSQRHQILVEWSSPQTISKLETDFLHELVRAQADRRPDAIALDTGQHQISYRQLTMRVNHLAFCLLCLGAGSEDRIAVLVDRSPQMVVALLAILETGAAYVPLDPTYPSNRLERILRDCGASILLTEEAAPRLPFAGLSLDLSAEGLTAGSAVSTNHKTKSHSSPLPDQLAYVLYTSGSTGHPKGVQITHRAIGNFIHSMAREPGLVPEDVMLAATTISFDIAGLELFLPLVTGARVRLADATTAADPFRLARALFESRVTVAQATPSGWRNLLTAINSFGPSDLPQSGSRLSGLKALSGGEGLPLDLVDQLISHGAEVWNLYGPTETAVWSTCRRLQNTLRSQGDPSRALATIGRPIDGTSTYLLDRHLDPVPLGAAGELCISGLGLSRGYLGQPRWTAVNFVPNRYGAQPGKRSYRTGDLVAQTVDGALHFLQRIDRQIKVRGFRIELGEIEASLEQLPSVYRAIAVVSDHPHTSDSLAVYVVPNAHDRETSAVEAQWQRQHVEQWRGVWNQIYSASEPGMTETVDSTFDLAGWVSSYTGNAISEPEMREWVDHTVDRILALKPRRILEIGCGTGLLLHRLAEGCDAYLATDLSTNVVSRLEPQVSSLGLANIQLRQQAANDFRGIQSGLFDTVVLNSVVQYFPSLEYLSEVLGKAVDRAAVGGAIFIGDVRNLLLLELLCASVEFALAPAELETRDLVGRARNRLRREQELVINPRFFTQLAAELPRISSVRIRPKAGHHTNEMVRFRYDVVLHLDGDGTDRRKPAAAPLSREVDWRHLDGLEAIHDILNTQEPSSLTVCKIPNQRLASARHLRELLDCHDTFDSVGALRRTVEASPVEGLVPEDFEALCSQLPYSCEASWARTDNSGCYDVVFWLQQAGSRPPISPIVPHDDSPTSNDPLYDTALRRLLPTWREHLVARLPPYMVPTAIVALNSLPMTPNGKVDRGTLTRLGGQHKGSKEHYIAPRTASEIALAEIWSEVLNQERIGVDEDFFGLGGHSLLATRVISRIRQRFGVEMPLRTLFEGPSLSRLARALDHFLRQRVRTNDLTDAPADDDSKVVDSVSCSDTDPIEPQPRDRNLPLSFAQQRLWFLQQLDPSHTAYNMPAAYRLNGSLVPTRLESALTAVAARHEVLRTRFPDDDGRPLQVISEQSSWQLPVVDLTALSHQRRDRAAHQLADQDARRPFDLSADLPVRALLMRLEPHQHILILNFHHIVTDGWSMGLFHHELAAHYLAALEQQSAKLPPLLIQYADFAHWQRRWLTGARLADQLRFWRQQLAEPTALALPADRSHPARRTNRGAARSFALSTAQGRALRSLSRDAGTSLFMTLLTVFNVLLHRLTSQTDLAVGSPIANRNREEIEGLVGFFVNTLVLRSDLSGRPSFRTLLGRVREIALNAYSHQDLPFEKLVEELQPDRDLSRNPLVQVSFALQNAPRTNIDLADVTLDTYPLPIRFTRFDLEVHLWEEAGSLRGSLLYSTELWDYTTIERMTRHLVRLLDESPRDPDCAIAELSLLDSAEQHQLRMEWGAHRSARHESSNWRSISRQVRDHVEHSPDRVALVCSDTFLSYRQLSQQVQSLADELHRLGAGAETKIGLLVNRSPQMVWGLLGILESGAAYLPLDSALPAKRLNEILTSSGAELLVTDVSTATDLTIPASCQTVFLDQRRPRTNRQDRDFVEPQAGQLAYVIYTSGSTGRPKGVQITHRAVANFLDSMAHEPGLTADDTLLAVTTVGFDIAVLELFLPLTQGACVVIARRPDDPDRLQELLVRSRTSLMQATPATWSNLIAAGWRGIPHLRMLCGGESLSPDLATELRQRGSELWNLYGPTETTIWSTVGRITPTDNTATPGPQPLGWPLAATNLEVLGPGLTTTPIAGLGELYISGAGLSRGYLAQPALTAEKLLPNPFNGRPGERLYHTGDQVQRLASGELRFLGRLDHQIKLRGFRIELGEIEAALAGHSQVGEAAVIYQETSGDGGGRLLAYLTLDSSIPVPPTEQDIRQEAQLKQWRKVWNDVYQQSTIPPQPTALTGYQSPDGMFDTSGWISSYSGEEIPPHEMHCWLDQIVLRITDLAPRRVLEIGCGTGMVLFRIAPGCESYTATDISPVVLETLQQRLASTAPELARVRLLHRPANSFEGFADGCFDTVILNSVVQYFPSVEYLLDVLRSAIRCTAPGGTIFIGDVRNLALHEAFCTSVEARLAEPSITIDALRQRVQRRRVDEEELLLSPAFFEALRDSESEVNSLQIVPKRGRHRNELNRFRFDAILQLGSSAVTRTSDNGLTPLEWRRDALTEERLRQVLNRPSERWVIHNLPDPRLASDLDLTRCLGESNLQDDGLYTLSALENTLVSRVATGLEPADVLALGHQLGYRTDTRLSSEGELGTFQAWFSRSPEDSPTTDLPNRTSTPVSWHDLANDPLRGGADRHLISQLRTYLSDRLPDYMIPNGFTVRETLPLTLNCKIDRAALNRSAETDVADGRFGATSTFVAPRGEVQETLADIWRELLGIDRLSAEDNVFELGAHSLLATRFVSRVRSTLGHELPVRTVFEAPTVQRFAEALESAALPHDVQLTPPLVRQVEGSSSALPLSFAQQRLWFLSQLEPTSSAYNLPMALRLVGDLDVESLASCLAEILQRHAVLRTTFPVENGAPRQAIACTAAVSLPVVDLTLLNDHDGLDETNKLTGEAAITPFELATGPLLRPLLLRRSRSQHVLMLTLHHIVSDAWSLDVLRRELATLYVDLNASRPSSLPTLPIQYVDFAIWQRRWLKGRRLEHQLAYWRKQLDALPTVKLPRDGSSEIRDTSRRRSGSVDRLLKTNLCTALTELGSTSGTSLFMMLLGAFGAWIGRATRRDDLVIGAPIANRNREETEGLIGFFVNTLVLRIDLSGDPTFNDLMARVRETCLGAYAHQDLPFEKLVEDLQPQRDLDRNPLFQILLNMLEGQREDPGHMAGLTMEPFPVGGRSETKLDATLHVVDRSGRVALHLIFDREVFDQTRMLRLLEGLEVLLTGAVDQPRVPLHELPTISAGQRHQVLVEWPGESSSTSSRHEFSMTRPWALVDLFGEQVTKRPDSIALTFGSRALSYGLLERLVTLWAHQLRQHQLGPDVAVGVLFRRSPELVAAVLAVFEVGAAYLPLDPQYPADRLAYQLNDGAARLVIAEPKLTARAARLPVPSITLSVSRQDLENSRANRASKTRKLSPNNLAYLAYTSGSTGRPKGVLATHGAAAAYLQCLTSAHQLGPDDISLQTAAVSFDSSLRDMIAPLLVGASVVLVSEEAAKDPSELAAAAARHRVSCLLSVVPTLMEHLLGALDNNSVPAGYLRLLLLSGESLPRSLSQRIVRYSGPRLRLVNQYGPTETTCTTTSHPIHLTHSTERTATGFHAIGRPNSDTKIVLLRPNLAAADLGYAGEVFIGGQGLARGYANRRRQTARVFVPDHSTANPGSRLYRTGDLARFRYNGQLVFLGRIDRQLKIRGIRVEPGDIESILKQHAAIREVAVIARQLGPGDIRLVAFLRLEPQDDALRAPYLADRWRRWLTPRLPAMIIPSQFVLLDKIPVTANGKLDRRALMDLEVSPASSPRESGDAAYSEETQVLLDIWREVLGVSVGLTDNFFDAGGHSLLAVRLLALIEQRLAVKLPLSSLFRGATIIDQAQAIHQPKQHTTLVEIQPNQHGTTTPQLPFFGIHPAGGNVLCYANLSRHLGADQPFYGLEARGFDGEGLHHNIPAMASDYLTAIRKRQPCGPYRLGGWSMGGLIAFEIAQQLRAQQQDVALLALIDTRLHRREGQTPDPIDGNQRFQAFARGLGLTTNGTRLPGSSLQPRNALTQILEQAKSAGLLSSETDLPRIWHLFRVFENNVLIMRRYTPKPYSGYVHLFRAEEYLEQESEDLTFGWDQIAIARFEVSVIPGTHSNMVHEPHVQALAEVLKCQLRRS